MINDALRLLRLGWSLVPVRHQEKMPMLASWKEFQSRRATGDEAQAWWGKAVEPPLEVPGMGVVCGRVSNNLVCLDFDDIGAYPRWGCANPKVANLLPVARSARGMHVFFRTAQPEKSGKLCLLGDTEAAEDLIAEGKFVVLPPPIQPSGPDRKWLWAPEGTFRC
jgi:hypothetical protein